MGFADQVSQLARRPQAFPDHTLARVLDRGDLHVISIAAVVGSETAEVETRLLRLPKLRPIRHIGLKAGLSNAAAVRIDVVRAPGLDVRVTELDCPQQAFTRGGSQSGTRSEERRVGKEVRLWAE